MSPKLELITAKKTEIAPQVFSVELVVQNTGYLPSYVSKVALKRKITRGVMGEIAGGELIEGKPRIEGPQLEGRAHYGTLTSFFPLANATPDRHVFRWVVRGKKGTKISVSAHHDRAGRVSAQITL